MSITRTHDYLINKSSYTRAEPRLKDVRSRGREHFLVMTEAHMHNFSGENLLSASKSLRIVDDHSILRTPTDAGRSISENTQAYKKTKEDI